MAGSVRKKTIYLVDTENVGLHWLEIAQQSKKQDRFILFYTGNSPSIPMKTMEEITTAGYKIECIHSETGINALDITLIVELSRLVEKNQSDNYIYKIISDDKGYDLAIRHLVLQGFDVDRIAVFKNHLKHLDTTHKHKSSDTTDPHKVLKPSDSSEMSKASEGIEASEGCTDTKPIKTNDDLDEAWIEKFSSHTDIKIKEINICIICLHSIMHKSNLIDRRKSFYIALSKRISNPEKLKTVYAKVRPIIRDITENGPFPIK